MATHPRLQNRASEMGPGVSSLPLARLRQVRERLENGFYDLPQVQAEVARRLRLELDILPPE